LGALLGRGADVGPGFSRLLPRSERTEPGGNLGEFFLRRSGILSRVGMRMVDPAIEERTWELASTRYCERSVVFSRFFLDRAGIERHPEG
jgi:hypothetical protein